MIRREIFAPAWLTARPIAHRGLHSRAKGLVENTPAAAAAAVAQRYAIECDIQRSRDGEAMVFHDFTLDRLTRAKGRVADFTAAELGAFAFMDCADKIAALPAFLAMIAGRTPLIIEIKSRFDGDMRLADRAAEITARYEGPAALKSFDPAILAHLRAAGPSSPLGLVAKACYEAAEWPELSSEARKRLADLSDYPRTQPDFLSWSVRDLPHAVPQLCRSGVGMPVMTWTVRTPADRALAATFADQIIFEGFEA